MLNLCFPPSRFTNEVRERERDLWSRVWAVSAVEGVIMEDLDSRDSPASVAILVVASLPSDLFDYLSRPGGPDLVSGFVEALESGKFPQLDEAAIGRANAGKGLDKIFLWTGYNGDEAPTAATVSLRSRVVAAYNDIFSGNRVRRISVESEDERLHQRFQGYGYSIIRQQRGKVLLSFSRDEAFAGTEISSQRFFSYDPPVLGFTSAQRDILLLARQGYTDQEVAAALGKSADSVKKRWSGIYARFAQVFPGRLPSAGEGSRGMEKRRTLLSYLRDRPEELRPYGP